MTEIESRETQEQDKTNSFGKWYDKNYKLLLLIPISILIFSFIYLAVFYSHNNGLVYKDFSLSGGTSITILGKINATTLKKSVSGKLDELNTREIFDLITREQKALIIETKTNTKDAKKILENYLGYELTNKNSSFVFIGPTLGQDFYRQLLIAILSAFLLMGIVVFIIFRNFIPSIAVIISAFADILMTLTVVDLLGIKMSSAGLVAFLMLIGYSVDTDILLTTRILKRQEGELNERLFGAFKTGIIMTLTSFFAVFSALIVVNSFSVVLFQIFTILAIGLGFDVLNTWITNVSMLKWYVEHKKNEN